MARLRFWIGLSLTLLSCFGTAQEKSARKARLVCVEPSTRIVKKVMPTFPEDVGPEHKLFGTVVLQFTVDEKGVPLKIKVTKGDRTLAAAAIKAIEQWRWEPLKLNGRPIQFETSVTINFEPRLKSD